MLNRTLALTLVAAVTPTAAIAATAPTSAVRTAPGDRQLADGTMVSRPTDTHRWGVAATGAKARSYGRLATELGGAWATWDALGEHPRQILAKGMPAPDSVADPAVAEAIARDLLTRHIHLLAPGSAADDFVLVANVESGGLRSVGFAQTSGGRPVVGGQVGFTFANDRLVMITDLAQPYAFVAAASGRVDDATARDRAARWVDDDLHPAHLDAAAPVEGPVILPVGDATTGVRYREVVRTEVAAKAPLDRFVVYLDAATGEPVARESLVHRASGVVQYNVPDRGPLASRSDRPIRTTQHIIDGQPDISDFDGVVSFFGPTSNIVPGLSGPLGQIVDELNPLATTTLVLSDGGAVTWNQAGDEVFDAQLTTYTHLVAVKYYVAQLDSSLTWLTQPSNAFVNIDDECNAMSDGDSLFFFRASNACENTGRISDVVYHEAGHSVHRQSLIPGVGSFDGALSEGVSDYLSATILDDSGMGRGFFYNNEPLRELNPQGFEYIWPQDNGEIHAAGRIIGGALWDLRALLIDKYGFAEGVRRADIVYYEGTRRAVDMPSMYGAALIANDDDGDLSNGTPDGCEINAAFGSHGLFSAVGGEATETITAGEIPEGLAVQVDLALPSFEGCPLEATARIEWGPRDGDGSTQTATMIPNEAGYAAVLPPLSPGQVLRYRVVIDYSVGAQRNVPANQGDPWLEHWFGAVDPLYCTSFDGAIADGWDVNNPWDVDIPGGLGGDPAEAAGADPFVLGLDLNGDGQYSPWLDTAVLSPVIAIPPGYTSIRLHYKRWLTVEDGFYDQARIRADGEIAWANFATENDFDGATVHHRDAQWVFHDVDLTPWAEDGEVQLGFELQSDGGLHMGGWTIDDLCVVGFNPSNQPTACGDGITEGAEQCDDGNLVDGDGCSAQCTTEDDDGGELPPDPEDPTDGDDPNLDGDSGLVDRGCVCSAGPNGEPTKGRWGAMGLWALLFLALRRRRI